MNDTIKVMLNRKEVIARKGATLSDITHGEKLCGGHGKCGKCKIIAKGALSAPSDTEKALLSRNELESGVRLACLTRALGDCEIKTLGDGNTVQIVTDGLLPEFELKPLFSRYGIAIDVGTTTLAARLYDNGGRLLSEVTRLNPEQSWGADVMTRIESALNGNAKAIENAIRTALCDMIKEFGSVVDLKQADAVVITGNSVMLSFITGQSVEPFSHAPFELLHAFGETLTASALSLDCLEGDTPVYLPPCISAFVGADITCAVLATGLCEKDTALLVDIGTNGEMALWHQNKLTVCSTAAGPAFEGVGIEMGMRGEIGAVDKVCIENGTLTAHVIGEGTAVGICGSGLVDAAACMLTLNVTDESGYLEKDEFIIKDGVHLTQKDLRMLQLAKSAICAGILTVADFKKLSPCDIPTVYIAGGFGNYLNKENAAKIGLLPRGISDVAKTVGNAALGGAVMLLLNRDLQKKAENITKNTKTLDLSVSPVFSEKYAFGMIFEEIR